MDRGSARLSRDLAHGGARLFGPIRPCWVQPGEGCRADLPGREYFGTIEIPRHSDAGLFGIPAALSDDLQLDLIVSRGWEIRVAAADHLGLQSAPPAEPISRVGLSHWSAGHAHHPI